MEKIMEQIMSDDYIIMEWGWRRYDISNGMGVEGVLNISATKKARHHKIEIEIDWKEKLGGSNTLPTPPALLQPSQPWPVCWSASPPGRPAISPSPSDIRLSKQKNTFLFVCLFVWTWRQSVWNMREWLGEPSWSALTKVMEKFLEVRREPGLESILLGGWTETGEELHLNKNSTNIMDERGWLKLGRLGTKVNYTI